MEIIMDLSIRNRHCWISVRMHHMHLKLVHVHLRVFFPCTGHGEKPVTLRQVEGSRGRQGALSPSLTGAALD